MKMVILLVKFLLLTEFDEAMLIVILQFSKKNINIIADKVTKNAKKLKITAIDKVRKIGNTNLTIYSQLLV